MIKAVIKDKEYLVPTTWADVKYKDAVKAIKILDADELLCFLIGMPIEELNSLEAKSVAILFNCIKFVEDISLFESNEPQEKYKDFDYGSQPYGNTEFVKKIMSTNPELNFMELAHQIIEKLTGDKIEDEPVTEVIGSVGFFLNQWIAFTSNLMNSAKAELMQGKNKQELEGSNDLEVLVLT